MQADGQTCPTARHRLLLIRRNNYLPVCIDQQCMAGEVITDGTGCFCGACDARTQQSALCYEYMRPAQFYFNRQELEMKWSRINNHIVLIPSTGNPSIGYTGRLSCSSLLWRLMPSNLCHFHLERSCVWPIWIHMKIHCIAHSATSNTRR